MLIGKAFVMRKVRFARKGYEGSGPQARTAFECFAAAGLVVTGVANLPKS